MGIGLEDGEGCVRALLVLPDGPAAQAGLRQGECVTHVGAEKVSRIDEMQDAVAASRPGVATTLSLADGRTLTVRRLDDGSHDGCVVAGGRCHPGVAGWHRTDTGARVEPDP